MLDVTWDQTHQPHIINLVIHKNKAQYFLLFKMSQSMFNVS